MKKTEDKSVIYKSLWIMGTVMILAVLIIELVSIFLIQSCLLYTSDAADEL